jgi:hypothetical protein
MDFSCPTRTPGVTKATHWCRYTLATPAVIVIRDVSLLVLTSERVSNKMSQRNVKRANKFVNAKRVQRYYSRKLQQGVR